MCVAACLKIAVIICCVILILMIIAYFVWISELDPDADDYAVAVFVYVFTAVLLWILAAIGIIGAVKEKPKLLLFFVISNVMNALFMLIQLILVAVTAGDCVDVPPDEVAKSPFGFVCFLANQASYFAPIVILIIFAIVCAVLACLLRAALDDDDDTDNDKEGKDKKGRNNYY